MGIYIASKYFPTKYLSIKKGKRTTLLWKKTGKYHLICEELTSVIGKLKLLPPDGMQ